MKILFFADPHWSSYSSIVRSRGKKYSTRLENLIESINWVERQAYYNNVDMVVCLGDFFDKSQMNAEEISALGEINWSDKQHYFLVGNHEMGRNDLAFSSAHLFNLIPNAKVIDKPITMQIDDFNELVFLPYLLDSSNYNLTSEFTPGKKHIVCSHNDIKGIQMGKFISTSGFDLNEINKTCEFFINGHLHNECRIGKLINLGNITGQNFSEDASVYDHKILILDTKTSKLSSMTNLNALNFYKVEYPTNKMPKFSTNSVVSISTSEKFKEEALEWSKQFLASRISINYAAAENAENYNKASIKREDELIKFANFVHENIGTSDIIEEELSLICSYGKEIE